MIRYIDHDGVILDTENGLFDEYDRIKSQDPTIKRLKYLQELNWREWIRQARIINDAINILKEHNPNDTVILTRTHSLNEGSVKIEYLRELGVRNNIILVPYDLSKSSVVSAFNNLLVDDSLNNSDEWRNANGIPILFNPNCGGGLISKGIQTIDSNYPSISSLSDVFSEDMDEYCKSLIKR